MAEETKYIDLEEFCDVGFLQEANRQFFHPLGLALEVNVAKGTMRVWDYRDDSEGVVFDPDAIKVDRIANVHRERLRHLMSRVLLFGDPDYVDARRPEIQVPSWRPNADDS